MKKYIATALFMGAFTQSALAYPAANMDEGYLYWSQRYKLENASPALCLADSAQSLNDFLSNQSLQTDIALELEKNCSELMFMAGVLPEMSKDMDADTRTFFKDNYGIAMYLSGLNPLKQGQFHKSGWWMLSYPVALKYGLRIDENIDERHDPVLASAAARRYYDDLYKNFNDEDLAILAFVTSPIEAKSAAHAMASGAALKAEHEALLTEIKSLRASFNWLIKRMPFTVTVENEPLKALELERDIQVEILLEELGIGLDDFMRYNPMFTGDVVPGNYNRSIVLPESQVAKYNKDSVEYKSVMFKDAEIAALWEKRERIKSNIPNPDKYTAKIYKVRSGDNLGSIGDKFGVRVSNIKTWNNLRTDVIYIGQKLTVYVPKGSTVSAPKEVKPKPQLKENKVAQTKATKLETLKSGDVVIYKVKSGDTLWSIARQYPGVSADNIMAWNGISENIRIDQELKIKKSEIRK